MAKAFIALFFYCLLSKNSTAGGKISFYLPDKTDTIANDLIWYKPIGNHAHLLYFFNNEKINIDAFGKAEIQASTPNPIIYTFSINSRFFWVFAGPNDSIAITILPDKFTNKSPNGGLLFSGQNSIGNNFINNYNWVASEKFLSLYDRLDSLDYRTSYSFKLLKLALESETAGFDELEKQEKVNNDFKEIVDGGFRLLLVSNIVRKILYDSRLSIPRKKKIVKEIYENYKLSDALLAGFPLGSSIASGFYSSVQLSHINSIEGRDTFFVRAGKKYRVNGNLSCWLYAPKKVREFFWTTSLISLKNNFPLDYSYRDIQAYNILNPDSPFKELFSESGLFKNEILPDKEKLMNVKFLTISEKATTLQIIQKNFLGKYVFIDLWATWCLPCIQEFAYNSVIDPFLKKNSIEKLYISLDKKEMKDKMKRTAFSQNLQGFHILQTTTLTKDIETLVYKDSGMVSIPRYLLIGKNGLVIDDDLPRPSSQRLIPLLEKLLAKEK